MGLLLFVVPGIWESTLLIRLGLSGVYTFLFLKQKAEKSYS